MTDMGYFPKPGDDAVLYAVWITYQFTESDTTLMLAPSGGSRFRIGSVETS